MLISIPVFPICLEESVDDSVDNEGVELAQDIVRYSMYIYI